MYFLRLKICNLCTPPLWQGPFNENPYTKLRLGRSKATAAVWATCAGDDTAQEALLEAAPDNFVSGSKKIKVGHFAPRVAPKKG